MIPSVLWPMSKFASLYSSWLAFDRSIYLSIEMRPIWLLQPLWAEVLQGCIWIWKHIYTALTALNTWILHLFGTWACFQKRPSLFSISIACEIRRFLHSWDLPLCWFEFLGRRFAYTFLQMPISQGVFFLSIKGVARAFILLHKSYITVLRLFHDLSISSILSQIGCFAQLLLLACVLPTLSRSKWGMHSCRKVCIDHTNRMFQCSYYIASKTDTSAVSVLGSTPLNHVCEA